MYDRKLVDSLGFGFWFFSALNSILFRFEYFVSKLIQINEPDQLFYFDCIYSVDADYYFISNVYAERCLIRARNATSVD